MDFYYLIMNTKPHTLFSGPKGVIIGLSTEENRLGFCTYGDSKLMCNQYDSEGKKKTNEVELTSADGNISMLFLDVLNLEKGLLTASVEKDIDSNQGQIFVTHFDERGEMGKFVEVDMKCDRQQIVVPKLYKNSKGDYCVTSICALDNSESLSSFSRKTRCFHKAELF